MAAKVIAVSKVLEEQKDGNRVEAEFNRRAAKLYPTGA